MVRNNIREANTKKKKRKGAGETRTRKVYRESEKESFQVKDRTYN